VLPQGLDWHGVIFVLKALTFDPVAFLKLLRFWVCAAFGRIGQDNFFKGAWLARLLPESNPELRREHRNWARVVLFGHLALAAAFIATGHWFLIVVFTFGCQYSYWLVVLCGGPQHAGLSPNVADFRLCCRTYTCSWLPAFFYWNMQYHVEHHMFPAVPFYHLPKLRQAIAHDLPPAPHGSVGDVAGAHSGPAPPAKRSRLRVRAATAGTVRWSSGSSRHSSPGTRGIPRCLSGCPEVGAGPADVTAAKG